MELHSYNIIQLTWFGGLSSTTVVKKCCPLLYVKVLCNVPTVLDVAMTAVNDPLSISDLKICRTTAPAVHIISTCIISLA